VISDQYDLRGLVNGHKSVYLLTGGALIDYHLLEIASGNAIMVFVNTGCYHKAAHVDDLQFHKAKSLSEPEVRHL
jgi:hypothetical protein